MSHSRSAHSALTRAFVVLVVFSGALIGTAGTSLAAPSTEVGSTTAGTTASAGPTIAGLSLGTLTWALVGFTVLVVGFVAASRAGRRAPATTAHTGHSSAVALRSLRPSSTGSQDEPTSAVTV